MTSLVYSPRVTYHSPNGPKRSMELSVKLSKGSPWESQKSDIMLLVDNSPGKAWSTSLSIVTYEIFCVPHSQKQKQRQWINKINNHVELAGTSCGNVT